MKIENLKPSVLFFLLLGGLWLWRWQATKPPIIPDGSQVRIRGWLKQEPALLAGQSQQFSLQAIKIRTQRFPEYHYGDYLEIIGVARQNQLFYPEIKKNDAPGATRYGLFAWLFKFRERVESIYNQTLPEPQASLLAGIVLGRKRGLPFEFYQALKKTSTMHVVVASGANISLVAQPLIANLSGFLPCQAVLPLATALIWLYALMAGFEAPVVRAALMASLAFLGQLFGRQRSGLWSLLLAALLMLFINPWLIADLGFQLSFGATLGILLFSARLQPFFRRLKFFGRDLATTLAAQVFILPLIYFHFREVDLLSPLVNALVLWTIDPLMQLGGLIGFAGLVSLPLAQIIAYPAWLLLTIFTKIIYLFS